ncbi:MAG: protein-L-isoaspartate O-methyltransferase family protein [Gammaproteobacteria bacterium]
MNGETLAESLRGRIRDKDVLAAINKVNRARFLDPSLRSRAAEDCPLPIGFSQTTSQPFVIARMLEMLTGSGGGRLAKVLEIGAGCGYQSAILGELCDSVVCMERVKALVAVAKANLRNCDNVRIMHGDGFGGCPDLAPFDGIVVCAEADVIPQQLVAQLAEKARLIMPLAGHKGVELVAVNNRGEVIKRREQVQFVPMLKNLA